MLASGNPSFKFKCSMDNSSQVLRRCAMITNTNFLIPISRQPDVVNLLIKFEISDFNAISLQRYMD